MLSRESKIVFMNNTTNTESVSRDIKTALKVAFPGTKFSVRMPRWGTVYVRWTDGPSSESVEAKLARFEAGHFDGMQDMYVRGPADPTTPNRATYVFASRDLSDGLKERIRADLQAKFSRVDDLFLDREVNALIRKTDLSGGYAGIHHGDNGWEIIEATPIKKVA